jgi:hypothetical protein
MNSKDICVLVSYDQNYAKLAKYSVDTNIKLYCEKYGYNLIIDEYDSLLPIDKPHTWQLSYRKIKIASNTLKDNNNFKWLFYIDVDSLIMNSDIRLESFIDDNYSFMALGHRMPALDNPIDVGIKGVDSIIMSHFFVKNNEDGLEILDAIWENEGWPENLPITEWDLEGRQVRLLINNPKYSSKIKVIDEDTISKLWYVNNPFVVLNLPGINDLAWKPGDFIAHVVGYKVEDRVQIISDLNYFSKLHNGYREI